MSWGSASSIVSQDKKKWPQIVPGELQSGCWEILLFQKNGWCWNGSWAAQGGGGDSKPGIVLGMFRCCVERCGLVRATGDRQTVGLGDLKGHF